MKLLSILVALFSLAAAAQVIPNGSTQVTQSATRQDASQCLNASGTAQQTITLPQPGPGLYHYVTSITSTAQATTAPAASAVTTTTTNLNSLSQVCGLAATAGPSCSWSINPATPIKSQASNTATTVVSNAAITNVTFTMTVCYYVAP